LQGLYAPTIWLKLLIFTTGVFQFDVYVLFADLGAVGAQAGAAQSNTQQFEGISSPLVHFLALFSYEILFPLAPLRSLRGFNLKQLRLLLRIIFLSTNPP
jgi:hypothetical protein